MSAQRTYGAEMYQCYYVLDGEKRIDTTRTLRDARKFALAIDDARIIRHWPKLIMSGLPALDEEVEDWRTPRLGRDYATSDGSAK